MRPIVESCPGAVRAIFLLRYHNGTNDLI